MLRVQKRLVILVIFLVITACSTVTLTPLPTSQPAPTIEASPIPTATTSNEIITAYGLPSVSAVLYGDAGNYELEAGILAEVTCPEAPAAADSYTFTLELHTDKPLLLIGSDTDDSDGVAVEWLIPEDISGELSATAHFADGSEMRSYAIDIHADKAVPTGTCVIRSHAIAALSVYREPSDTTEIIGVMYPSSMLEVIGKNSNGSYKVKTDEVYSPTEYEKIGPGLAWVHETSTELFGACENLPNE